MSIIKKIDVKEYFAARRRRSKDLFQIASLLDATEFSRVPPAPRTSNKEALVEDSLRQPAVIGLGKPAIASVSKSDGTFVPSVSTSVVS